MNSNFSAYYIHGQTPASTTEPSAARSETLSAPKTPDPLSTKEIIYKKPIMIDDIVFTTTVDVMMKALQKRKGKSTLEGFGIGSTRSLWFGNGLDGKEAWDHKPVREQLVHADGVAYSLRWQTFNDNIGEVLSFSTLTLRAISDNTTEITWSGETTFPDGPVRDGLKVFIEAMYIGAMEAIAKRLEK
ncbi:bet v i allergen [Verticillium dahliae]